MDFSVSFKQSRESLTSSFLSLKWVGSFLEQQLGQLIPESPRETRGHLDLAQAFLRQHRALSSAPGLTGRCHLAFVRPHMTPKGLLLCLGLPVSCGPRLTQMPGRQERPSGGWRSGSIKWCSLIWVCFLHKQKVIFFVHGHLHTWKTLIAARGNQL